MAGGMPTFRQFMKKEKELQKQLPDTELHRGFLTYMEYGATGEGMTYEINFCYADNKEEAIEIHLDRFIGKTNKSARDYFRVGVAVYDSKSTKAMELLEYFFKNNVDIFKHLNGAGQEFHFKLHYNYS